MNYTIQSKSDLSAGAMLVVTFPEEELDRKALETIQFDPPGFLVPFRHRSVNGQVECTYQLGSRTKLQYRFGSRSPRDYVAFWEQVLQPLLDCGDWFLTPYSFVMDPQYLFVDRQGGEVSYLYIPSKEPCSDYGTLCSLVAELSRRNGVTDPALENKVLRAIMQDFRPKEFLGMLRQAMRDAPAPQPAAPAPAPAPAPTPAPAPAPASEPAPAPAAAPQPGYSDPKPQGASQASGLFPGMEDDIVIDLSGGGKKEKEKGWGLFGKKGKKAPKEEPHKEEPHKRGGLFQKKEAPAQELLLGAAAQPVPDPVQVIPQQSWAPPTEESCEATQLSDEMNCPRLCLIGDPSLPREIPVEIEVGRPFTIGRFDVSVGRPQSDFEFDKRTRAVSRHHAAIERGPEGYTVQDLSSSAGTFVDGEKLIPNVPKPLRQGSRIAFGTGGAEYIWEE